MKTIDTKNVTQNVIATLGYVQKFSGSTILIKLGGAALQDAGLVDSICEDLIRIRSVGVSVVLVHGGGPAINEELTRRGIQWSFIEGQRVTTPEMMDVIETILCGTVNRKIVRALNAAGVKAVGFSGTDAGTLVCKPADERLGRVGQIEKVNISLIHSVLNLQNEMGIPAIPVIAPVGLGKDGLAFNINADWAASRIASSLGVTKMLFLTDQDGILDPNKKLIPELDASELENLIETGVVSGGMLAKARTIVHALKHKVTDVHILNARRPHGLIEELFTDRGVGTVCRLRSRAYTASEGTEKALET
ncbi:MAG: acetylglutamate kinase [Bdellovibrionaceae bacterium]|nr:acetylglutamate kinase [Pseudobdellovibrionaceae bacterium]